MPDAAPSLYMATLCYGGTAHAAYARGLLELERACAAEGLPLRVDLNGGDALVGRGRAAVLANFLKSDASLLLMIDPDVAFSPKDVLTLVAAGKDLVGAGAPGGGFEVSAGGSDGPGLQEVDAVDAGFLLLSRSAARRMAEAYPDLSARLGDLGGTGGGAVMVFDSVIEPESGRYLGDAESFCLRWRGIGGRVWLARGLTVTRAA